MAKRKLQGSQPTAISVDQAVTLLTNIEGACEFIRMLNASGQLAKVMRVVQQVIDACENGTLEKVQVTAAKWKTKTPTLTILVKLI